MQNTKICRLIIRGITYNEESFNKVTIATRGAGKPQGVTINVNANKVYYLSEGWE